MPKSSCASWLILAFGAGAILAGAARPATAAPPPNDDFDAAIQVSTLPFTDTQDAVDATTAPDDPPSSCGYSGVTLWYDFTPTADQRLEALATYVSNLHVYTGDRGTLTELACASGGSSPPTVLRFDAAAGTTYHIMVGVFATPPVPAIVQFTLQVPPPPPANDDFDNARAIPGLPHTDTLDTSGATAAPDDPWCFGQAASVWYSFTPSSDLRLELNTQGSSYSATLSVYTGLRGSLNQLACSAFGLGSDARVRLDVQAGVTYYVMVGTYFQTYGGQLVLSALLAPPPFQFALRLDTRGSVRPATGTVTLTGTATCSEPAFVFLSGVLKQSRAAQSVDGFFDAGFVCDGTTTWSATPFYNPRLFRGRAALLYSAGKADVSAYAQAFSFSSGEVRSVSISGSVLLTGAP
jgi:hypothetical protein